MWSVVLYAVVGLLLLIVLAIVQKIAQHFQTLKILEFYRAQGVHVPAGFNKFLGHVSLLK